VTVGLIIIQAEARIGLARWKGKALVFRFPLLFRAGIAWTPAFLGYLLVRDWSGEDWLIRVLGVILVLWFLFAWPPTILLTSQGIERRWWWRPRIFIPWNEVVDADLNAGGDMTIVGTDASIQFSRFQCDPERFRSEVRKRSKIGKFHKPEDMIDLHL
jgi:hypothetical protein